MAVALCSCTTSNTKMKVTANGSIYELLVVMNDYYWNGPVGDSLRTYIEADMPCLPQMESYFTVMHTPLAYYDDALKATRNILIVDIDMRYSQPKISFHKDVYAHPQAIAVVHLPLEVDAAEYIGEHGKQIQDFFLRQELLRQAAFYKTGFNQEAVRKAKEIFDIEISIPSDYQVIMEDSDFLWCCNDNGPKRRDIVIYSYPYTDKNTFTQEYLCAKRDSVMRRVGDIENGHYMGTEYRERYAPQYRSITVNDGGFCGELRGLWKIKTDIPGNGVSMGGPFVQHSRVDEFNQRVICTEVFVYAAGQKKRNVYRQAEAILYTMKLPQEINALKEVSVTATSAK